MIDLSKRPDGCFEPDSDPNSSTGGFLEPDSGLAGQSGWENKAGGARAGRASGADGVGLGAGVSNDGGGRVVSDRGGWLGAGRVVGGGWCGRARGGMGGR